MLLVLREWKGWYRGGLCPQNRYCALVLLILTHTAGHAALPCILTRDGLEWVSSGVEAKIKKSGGYRRSPCPGILRKGQELKGSIKVSHLARQVLGDLIEELAGVRYVRRYK